LSDQLTLKCGEKFNRLKKRAWYSCKGKVQSSIISMHYV
jgi:hypothetical protein